MAGDSKAFAFTIICKKFISSLENEVLIMYNDIKFTKTELEHNSHVK